MSFDAGKYVYDRLKALGDHNSIRDLNGLRLGYRRSAREHEETIKAICESWKGYPEHYYQEDLERHKEAAESFRAMEKAVEKLIKERNAEQKSISARTERNNRP